MSCNTNLKEVQAAMVQAAKSWFGDIENMIQVFHTSSYVTAAKINTTPNVKYNLNCVLVAQWRILELNSDLFGTYCHTNSLEVNFPRQREMVGIEETSGSKQRKGIRKREDKIYGLTRELASYHDNRDDLINDLTPLKKKNQATLLHRGEKHSF